VAGARITIGSEQRSHLVPVIAKCSRLKDADPAIAFVYHADPTPGIDLDLDRIGEVALSLSGTEMAGQQASIGVIVGEHSAMPLKDKKTAVSGKR